MILPREYLTTGVDLALHPGRNLDVGLSYDMLVNIGHASGQQGGVWVDWRF